MPSFGSHYDVLGIDRGATENQIKTAYRKLVLKHHPDKSRDPASIEIFQATQAAYECLMDPAKREEYDYSTRHPERYDARNPDGYASSYDPPSPPMPRSSHGTSNRAQHSHWAADERPRPAANSQSSYRFFPDATDQRYRPNHGQYPHRDPYSPRGRMDAEYEVRYPPSSRRDYEEDNSDSRPNPSDRQPWSRGYARDADHRTSMSGSNFRERDFHSSSTYPRHHAQQYDTFEEESRQLRDDGRRMHGPNGYYYHDDFDTWDASAPRGPETGYPQYQASRQRQHFQRVRGYQTDIDRGYETQIREAHIRMSSHRVDYDIPYRHGYSSYGGRPVYPRFYRFGR